MLGLDPEPSEKRVLDYGSPPPRGVGWTVLGALSGVAGFIGLFYGNQYLLYGLGMNQIMPLFATLPPLLVMAVLAWLFKSRPMLIASLITFAMFFLACGTCYVLVSGLHG